MVKTIVDSAPDKLVCNNVQIALYCVISHKKVAIDFLVRFEVDRIQYNLNITLRRSFELASDSDQSE